MIKEKLTLLRAGFPLLSGSQGVWLNLCPTGEPRLRDGSVDTEVINISARSDLVLGLKSRKRTRLAVVCLNVSVKKESLDHLLEAFVLWILLEQTFPRNSTIVMGKKIFSA